MRALVGAMMLAVSAPVVAAPCADDAKLRRVKTVLWSQLYREQDAEGLKHLLHDDFRTIDATGTISTKAQELAWLASNTWAVTGFAYKVRFITCVGDTALIVGEGSGQGKNGSFFYVSSNTFVKTARGWQVLVSHISGERTLATN